MRKLNAKAVCAALLLFAALTFASPSALAQQPIQTEQILNNLVLPTYVTYPKDDSQRLFVLLKNGVIRVRHPGTGATSDFIDITSRVLSAVSVNNERGLLGLAFHPQFATNRKFYLNYTRQPDGATVVAEYVAEAGAQTANPATERILLVIPQPFANHNGGMIEFGPDGNLYIGMGDGGSANDPGNRAQNRSELLGKMLRIGVDPSGNLPYTIPADNPFVGAGTNPCPQGASPTAGNTCQEIWTIGMRNPWRWSFDRGGTRQMYIADVGQNAIEEIDIGVAGGNYGWRVYEGTACTNLDPTRCPSGTNPLTQIAPIFEYSHTGGRCSITGGYVYRGRRGTFPQGAYIYADYCTGEIWQLLNGNNTLVLDTTFLISSFGEDEAGEIYFTTNSTTAGGVYKFVNPNATAPRNVVGDFDGDLKTDFSVFRPSNNTWYFADSLTGGGNPSYFRAVQFGLSTDRLTPADFDGDGKADIAVFRNGVWYSIDSSNGAFRAFQFGAAGDIPVAGDYDGDRRSDYAVFRNGVWYIRNSGNGSLRAEQFGLANDALVPADYDGDGRTDLAVLRPNGNIWLISRSRDGFYAQQWGSNGDLAVPGDYDGDGKYDIAVFRPGTGNWFALQSSNGALYARQWGATGDTPVPGDYDGDGKTDPAIVRNLGGAKSWYYLRSNSIISGNNFRQFTFGTSTDMAVVSNDIP